jgi:hypothetical protein
MVACGEPFREGAPGPGDAGTPSAPSVDAGPAVDAHPPVDVRAPPGDASLVPPLRAELRRMGYATSDGLFAPVDLSDCCMAGAYCFGTNASSTYFAFFAPPSPGSSVADPTFLRPAVDGGAPSLSMAWRLGEGEAMVYVGPTPPNASYFGFTPYLFDREVDAGTRDVLFASLSDTLNNLTLDVAAGGSPFGSTTVVIAAVDAKTERDVASALVRSGYDPATFNTLALGSTRARFGLDEAADSFAIWFRVAEFAPSTRKEGAAWVREPHGTMLRVTPRVESVPEPLAPVSRASGVSMSERSGSLEASVTALEKAIVARYASMTPTRVPVGYVGDDPASCIDKGEDCGGDNPDTDYLQTAFAPWVSGDDSYVVYGVNHAATGKTQYSAFAAIARDHGVGVAGMTSASYAGSAAAFVPADPNVSLLYACLLAPTCAGVPADQCCLEVPAGSCPDGIDPGASFAIKLWTYLDPTTKTAPEPSTLILDRVLKLSSP